ncbi:MAG: hypothetical protein ABW193_06670, partial [Luteibacter sp.]
FQVARMVRRIESLETLPIVAVTARSAGDEWASVRAAGMDALLRKPMSGDDLGAVLEQLCRTKPGTGPGRVNDTPAVESRPLLAEAPEVGEGAGYEHTGG